jgi:PhnB protein
MASLHTYINFNGNTEEAFNFYKSVFKSEFIVLQRFSDIPDAGNIAEADKNKIMHVALPIGGTILMGTDITGDMPKAVLGTAISLSIDTSSEEETQEIFNGLATGGNITMALEKTFWGALFGMVNDKFGVQWMVNYDYKDENK